MSAKAFMKDYSAGTEAMMGGLRKYEGNVTVRLAPDGDESNVVWIDTINAKQPGKGHGRKVMEWLTALADEHQVILKLDAVPIGNNKIPEAKLIQFYKDFGFDQPYGDSGMERQVAGTIDNSSQDLSAESLNSCYKGKGTDVCQNQLLNKKNSSSRTSLKRSKPVVHTTSEFWRVWDKSASIKSTIDTLMLPTAMDCESNLLRLLPPDTQEKFKAWMDARIEIQDERILSQEKGDMALVHTIEVDLFGYTFTFLGVISTFMTDAPAYELGYTQFILSKEPTLIEPVQAKFETGLQARNAYVEVFRNPSAGELKDAQGEYGSELRAFLDGDDILVWDVVKALHAEVAGQVKFKHPDPIPLMVYFGDDGVAASVTDFSKRGKWNHNPEVADVVRAHPWMKKFSKGNPIDVNYYDEDIVGPWEEMEEAAAQVQADFSDHVHDDVWVHYSNLPQVTINPKGFHQDPAGIYLFPKDFNPNPNWKLMKHRFEVKLDPSAKVMDLGKLTSEEALKILQDLGLEDAAGDVSDPERPHDRQIDSFWEIMKNQYILKDGKRPGEWNRALRDLGYDAVFDDTGVIHTSEEQLLVLNTRKIKVLKMSDLNNTGYADLLQVMKEVEGIVSKYGKTEVSKPKKVNQWNATELKGEIHVYDGEKPYTGHYAVWTVSPRIHDKKDSQPTEISIRLSSSSHRFEYSQGVTIDRLGRNNKPGMDLSDISSNIPETMDKIWEAAGRASSSLDSVLAGNVAADAAKTTADLIQIAQRLISELFSGTELQVPDFKVVNQRTANWLGRATMNPTMKRPLVEIQKSVMGDEKSLDRIMAHELIHCLQYTTDPQYVEYFKKSPIDRRHSRRYLDDGHGQFFQEWAAKVNAIKGEAFVTETSDSDVVTAPDTGDFFILIEPYKDGRFAVGTFIRPNKDNKFEVNRRQEKNQAKLFKSNDSTLLMPKSMSAWGKNIFIPAKEERQAKLKELYESGKTVTVSSTAVRSLSEELQQFVDLSGEPYKTYDYLMSKEADVDWQEEIDSNREDATFDDEEARSDWAKSEEEMANNDGFPSNFFDKARPIAPGSWLIHFTEADPMDIVSSGFRGRDLYILGLTTGWKPESQSGDYALAFEPDHISGHGREFGKYGKNAVLFQVKEGATAYHYGDEEKQTVFLVKDAYNLHPVYGDDDSLTLYDTQGQNELMTCDRNHDCVSELIAKLPDIEVTSSIGDWEKNGITFETKSSQGEYGFDDDQKFFMVSAMKNGKKIGKADFLVTKNGLRAVSTAVDSEYRRLGVAQEMYDVAERETGLDALPGNDQSQDAKNFWKNRIELLSSQTTSLSKEFEIISFDDVPSSKVSWIEDLDKIQEESGIEVFDQDARFGVIAHDQVVGAIWCEEGGGLFSVAVDPKYQSQGIARSLVEKLIEFGKVKNWEFLIATPVHPAIKHLVKDLGFTYRGNSDWYLSLEKDEKSEGALGDWKGHGITFKTESGQTKFGQIATFSVMAETADGTLVGVVEFEQVGNGWEPQSVNVNPKFQRMGIASEMYRLAEAETGMKVTPSESQSGEGKKLWTNPDRPFGKKAIAAETKEDLTPKVEALVQTLEKQYPVKLTLFYRKNPESLKLDGIFLPKDKRGEGIGSKVMEAVVAFADTHGLITLLTPSVDFGATSVARLRKFYGEFGFKRNFGSKKDFRFSEAMIRLPKSNKKVETAKPSDAHKNSKYYHGTSRDDRAMKIWEDGIKPDLSTTPETNVSRPVAGRVYLATNVKQSLPYVLGGDYSGSELSEKHMEGSPYGYLFVVPGSALTDIQPDEDQVGEAVHDRAFDWIEDYLDIISREDPETDDEEEDEDGNIVHQPDRFKYHGDLLEQIDAGEYAAYIKAGHVLLPHLTDEQKHEIIEKYGNIANQGVVMPTEMWRFDKRKSEQLKRDGSNFFQLAEKVKTREKSPIKSSYYSKEFTPGKTYDPNTVWKLIETTDPKVEDYESSNEMPVKKRAFQTEGYVFEPEFDYRKIPSGFDHDHERAQEYAQDLIQALEEGEVPPIVVLKDNKGYYLVDGYHRIQAALSLGLKTLPALVGDLISSDSRRLNASIPDLSKAITFETGKEVTFPYMRNLQKAPDMGARFGQHIEPQGEYLLYKEPGSQENLPNYEYGTLTFKNPLVVPLESKEHPMDSSKESWGWKSQLSKQFGKKGKALSDHLKKLGYDGIITQDKYGTSEIVNLSGTKKQASTASIPDLSKALPEWAPQQVHEKLPQVVEVANQHMPEGVFLQATVELQDDVPVVRVLTGPNDPYTAERIGSFAFYSTQRAMEWYQKFSGQAFPFVPGEMMVYLSYFDDKAQLETAVGVLDLRDTDEDWAWELLSIFNISPALPVVSATAAPLVPFMGNDGKLPTEAYAAIKERQFEVLKSVTFEDFQKLLDNLLIDLHLEEQFRPSLAGVVNEIRYQLGYQPL